MTEPDEGFRHHDRDEETERKLDLIIEEQREQRELIRQIFRRLDQGANITVNVSTPDVQTLTLGGLVQVALIPPPPGPAVAARIIIKGDRMAISVDETNEVVSLEYDDDKNDVTTAPEDSSVAWTSSDETIATVDATSGAVSPLAVGTVSISASVNDATGAPLAGFTQPDPISLEIDPGAAVGARIKESV